MENNQRSINVIFDLSFLLKFLKNQNQNETHLLIMNLLMDVDSFLKWFFIINTEKTFVWIPKNYNHCQIKDSN